MRKKNVVVICEPYSFHFSSIYVDNIKPDAYILMLLESLI